MSEPLFALPEPPEPVVEPVTERTMLDLLVKRYTRISMNAHRYAFAGHVPNRTGFASRIADFMAVDCYSSGPWEARQNAIHGHEVKVSRSDWLAELRDPLKAEAFRPYVHYWWLVVPSRLIVHDGELPKGWGLLERAGGCLRAVVRAPRLVPQPMPSTMTAAFMRAIAKTARADLSRVPANPNGAEA